MSHIFSYRHTFLEHLRLCSCVCVCVCVYQSYERAHTYARLCYCTEKNTWLAGLGDGFNWITPVWLMRHQWHFHCYPLGFRVALLPLRISTVIVASYLMEMLTTLKILCIYCSGH